jgi:hypothetical protein
MWKYRMEPELILEAWRSRFRQGLFALSCLLLAACATDPQLPPSAVVRREELPPVPISTLAYYQMLHRMSAAEIGRERMVLAALPGNSNNQVRLAMVLGHPRGPQDLPRAIALLDGVLKSAEAAALHPLARLLIDNYQERQKQDVQQDKLGVQLKESQRKAVELQEKIDNLADIERTLPQRPRSARPLQGGSK